MQRAHVFSNNTRGSEAAISLVICADSLHCHLAREVMRSSFPIRTDRQSKTKKPLCEIIKTQKVLKLYICNVYINRHITLASLICKSKFRKIDGVFDFLMPKRSAVIIDPANGIHSRAAFHFSHSVVNTHSNFISPTPRESKAFMLKMCPRTWECHF